jgi:hypothetical protein
MPREKQTLQELLLKDVTALLRKANIPYMITGSLSVILYGRPRASHDIDFLIEAKEEDVERIKKTFVSLSQSEFIVDPFLIEDAIRNLRQFNVLHLPTMLKLDFWLLTDERFDQVRFKRKRSIQAFGQTISFASAEDTILIKLLWYKDSKSEKHLIDAAFVYQVQKENLDQSYLKKWAKEQGTTKLLKEIAAIELEQYY